MVVAVGGSYTVTAFSLEGIETSAYVAMLCQHYDCLRPLVLVIKHVLVCDGLVTPYDGGMSSYTLVSILGCGVVRFRIGPHGGIFPKSILWQ